MEGDACHAKRLNESTMKLAQCLRFNGPKVSYTSSKSCVQRVPLIACPPLHTHTRTHTQTHTKPFQKKKSREEYSLYFLIEKYQASKNVHFLQYTGRFLGFDVDEISFWHRVVWYMDTKTQLTFVSTYQTTRCHDTEQSHWAQAFLKKHIGPQLLNTFLVLHGTQMFITAFTSSRHLSLSWPRQIYAIPLRVHFNIIPQEILFLSPIENNMFIMYTAKYI